MEKVPMTRDGFNKMNEQYQHMRTVELKECLQALTDARDKGDLSENAEYEVAKQALDELNNRMSKISTLLANVQIVEGAVDDGTVQMLTYVKFKNLKTNSEIEYKIVPDVIPDVFDSPPANMIVLLFAKVLHVINKVFADVAIFHVIPSFE